MKRNSFLLSGAGALLAGCAGGVSSPGLTSSNPPLAGAGRGPRTPYTFGYLGQLLLVPYSYVPAGWALCDGSELPAKDFPALSALLGKRFGGNGSTTFGLPDLRGREPLKGLTYIIALYGDAPSNDSYNLRYYGELLLVPYDVTPKGWMPCDGSLLQINSNQALFSLLGIQFGGDGIKTFGIPDTRGHEPAPGLKYLISLGGMWPSHASSSRRGPATDVYAGELLLLPYYTPEGWLPCGGSLLSISQNTVLFSLVGTKFGGNGTSTFGLPDMSGHKPIDYVNYVIATPGIYPPRG